MGTIPSYSRGKPQRAAAALGAVPAPVALTCGRGNRSSAIPLAGIGGNLEHIDPHAEGFGPQEGPVDEHEGPAIRFLPRNLTEAPDTLALDNSFLRRRGIFSDELLGQWMLLKQQEIRSVGTMPQPYQYKLYFNL